MFLLLSNEGDELYGQGNAPDATKDPELNVQSEGSHSPTGVALEASTHSVTGLLYDYMDGDTGKMNHISNVSIPNNSSIL